MMDEQSPAQGRSGAAAARTAQDDASSDNSSKNSNSSTNSHTNEGGRNTTAFESENRSTAYGIRTSNVNNSNINNTSGNNTTFQRDVEETQTGGPRTSLVSGGSETCSYNTTGSNSNRALADTSQGSGASSVLPVSGGRTLQPGGYQESVNFGGNSSSVVSSPNRATAGGDGFSRRVTLGGGTSSAAGMVAGGATTTSTSAGVLLGTDNRRNSLSSLSLMDDIFGKRASMGLGSTAATALSAMGTTAGPTGGMGAGVGGGSGGGGDMDSTAMMSVVGSGGPNIGSGGSMFGRRGSMDSTTAALDAAIFDLTRRRYSMANSSLVGSSGAGAIGNLVAGSGGAATINSLSGGDRSYTGMSGHATNPEFGSAGNFDSSGRGTMGVTSGSDGRRASLDAASAGGGASVGGMGSGSGGMDYDSSLPNATGGTGNMGLNLPAGVTPGMNNSGMMDQFVQQHSQSRMRNMTNNLAARQQQLQAQQRELERRQRELEQQRRDLIASMQQRKLMMQSQPHLPQSSQSSHLAHSYGTGGMLPGNDSRYDSLLQQGGAGGGGGANKSGFNDPLTGPYSHLTSGGVGANMNNNSDHSSRGGMGQGTNNSGGGGSHSSGSQQWWICQVCNTKAFASHDEALAHEAICVRVQQQQGNTLSGSNSSSKRGHYDPQDDSQFNYSSPQSQRQRGPSGRHRGRGMDMSSSNNTSKYHGSGMDSSMRTIHTTATTATSNSYEPVFSTGPFATLENPLPLAMVTDKDWLTPLHCFVRKHCVEVFCASEADVAAPSKGKRKPIQVGQIGIRCPHCHPNSPSMANIKAKSSSSEGSGKARERGSVYYPTTIASIYNATMNLLQRHLHSCAAVPPEVMSRYETLKSDDARSGTSKKYWIESALALGLVDTEMGIRFSASTPPPLPQLTDSQKDMQKHIKDQTDTSPGDDEDEDEEGEGGAARSGNVARSATNEEELSPLTAPEDKSYSTAFSYHLLSQMRPCVFTEADRLGKRKGLPPGFRGLACRFCFGGYGSGRFFPSSIKTLSDTSKTLNVLHNHMIRCRKCPAAVREKLEQLRGTHDEERAKMKFGSQKAFFARIWDRLHGTAKASDKSPKAAKQEGGESSAKSPKRKAPPSSSEKQGSPEGKMAATSNTPGSSSKNQSEEDSGPNKKAKVSKEDSES